MIKRKTLIETGSFDPFHNQAIEKVLFDGVREGEIILYLWQNERTVVIGKNQNARNEVQTDILERDGGKLARRLSGGGAVYHDRGNLNVTFLCRKEDHDLDKEDEVLIGALKILGIEAKKNGRNDLTADDRKFSGHAYYRQKDRVFHHATVMVDVDKEDLTRYLRVSQKKLHDKGVPSVRSRVIDLRELDPSLTIGKLKEALIASFAERYPGDLGTLREEDLDPVLIREGESFFADSEWRYGKDTPHEFAREERFSWGTVTLEYDLNEEKISGLEIYTDALHPEKIETIPGRWEGKTIQEILTLPMTCPEEEDLRSMFKEEGHD